MLKLMPFGTLVILPGIWVKWEVRSGGGSPVILDSHHAAHVASACRRLLLSRAQPGQCPREVFHKDQDFQAFLDMIAQASLRQPMPILAYCLMPNHFHLVLWPRHDGDISRWVHWLLTTHVRRYQKHYHSSGHVWQGRFKSFPIQEDDHLRVVLRYVERNPLRAGLVERAEDWRWSSLHALSTDSSGPIQFDPARRLGAPAGWRTSTPRCLTMMLPESANPSDETACWAIPPGRWRLPGPWAWNPASAHPAARSGLQWSDQDPRGQSVPAASYAERPCNPRPRSQTTHFPHSSSKTTSIPFRLLPLRRVSSR